MNIVRNLSIVLILTTVCVNLKAQNTDACYYQIAERGKQLYKITEGKNQLNYQKMDFQFDTPVYLLAFNQKKKELLAISRGCHLLKINNAGEIYESVHLPNIEYPEALLVAITDKKENLYVAYSNLSTIYKIELDKDYKVTKLSSQLNSDVYDLAYQKKTNTFWSINNKGQLIGLNAKNFELSSTSELGLPTGCYGSVWFDGKETLYAHHNKQSKIYSINLKTKDAFIKDTAPFFGDWNDGTACYKVPKNKSKKENTNPVLSSTQLKESLKISEIELSPNPNQGKFKIHYTGLHPPNAEWVVTDITGRIVHRSSFNELEEIELKNVAPGNYTIQIVEDKVVLDHKKFVIH